MDLVHNKEKINEFRKRAQAIVDKMTLEELVLQTLHQAPAVEHLGIPAYNWWNEALHGVARAGAATVFPQAIGLAATFDEDFLEEIADAISTEGRAKYNMQQDFLDSDIYKGLTFWSPNVNIFRDPRWGRGQETFGEDPYLSSRLGVRFVQGLQGHDERYLKSAACAKHFAVHSGPEAERHSFNAVASKQDLYETYLPAFKACVQEGKVEAVMGAYNRTNGVPCCGSKQLLIDILRDEWGFEGHVVSDCWAIKDFHENHRVTKDAVESVAMAMNNGCDLNCGNLFYLLLDAVQKGMVNEKRLREAVTNLFATRIKLGVLDQKEETPYDQISYSVVDSPAMRQLNQKAAQKCICLLKNEKNLLPLDKNKLKTVGVIGPNADSRKALVGNYEGTASRYVTISEGIQDYLGDSVRVMVSDGCDLYKDRKSGLGSANDRISEVKGICRESDVVVVVLGLDADLEGEEGDVGNQFASGDKLDLKLPGLQEDILKTAYESGKPVVLVLLSGSALEVSWADEHIPAIIQGWYPGAQGGYAIARLIFGEENFEGKLPVTFYRTTEELPDFKDYSMYNRTYRYMKQEPLYPFGYGLSYTTFAYSNVALNKSRLDRDGAAVSADVTNTGTYDGRETVQVYVKAPVTDGPNRQLKGIRKVSLKSGETKRVEIPLPIEAFSLYDVDGVRHVAKGDFFISIGGSQPEPRSEALTGQKVTVLKLKNDEELVL